MIKEPSVLRIASQWVIAIILAVVLAALFLLLASVQLTAEDTGKRAQRRSVATLTDIDARLPAIEAALSAAGSTPGNTVQVPAFPLPVQLTADEAKTLRGAALRDRILDDSATLLYDRGMGAWASADQAGVQRIDRVSSAGLVKTGLGMVRDSRHTIFVIAAILLAIVSLMLAAGLMMTIHDWNMRFVAMGSVVLAAALPCLAAAIAVRFAFKTAQTDADSFTKEMLDLGIGAVWIPIRDYLALSALGFGVAGLGALGMWLQSRPNQAPGPVLPRGE